MRGNEFDQRDAAATLRALRRYKSSSAENPVISPTQAVRRVRDVPSTASVLNHIRSSLKDARSAARICADILEAQAADLDNEVALTLRRNVCSALTSQIQHIRGLLNGVLGRRMLPDRLHRETK